MFLVKIATVQIIFLQFYQHIHYINLRLINKGHLVVLKYIVIRQILLTISMATRQTKHSPPSDILRHVHNMNLPSSLCTPVE